MVYLGLPIKTCDFPWFYCDFTWFTWVYLLNNQRVPHKARFLPWETRATWEAEWAKWQKQLREWRQSYDEPRAFNFWRRFLQGGAPGR